MTAETSLARDVSHSAIPSPGIISREKALMSKFKVQIHVHEQSYYIVHYIRRKEEGKEGRKK